MTLSDWLPTTHEKSDGWRLDVVSVLAIVGEESMAEHVQPLTATRLCYLPRIIPAPQAMLKSNRPARMPEHPAKVVGVKSGNDVDTVNYFANLIHEVETVKKHECRVYKITHADNPETYEIITPSVKYDDSSQEKVQANPQKPKKIKRLRADIPTNRFSPLNILTVVSFFLTLGLFGWSIAIKDGVACVALFTISTASSVIGLASKWKSKVTLRTATAKVPDGDVVIRTREGAFIIVKCSEDVARELYIGTEECKYYVTDRSFRALVGFGTFLLMVSVVMLGNCKWTMQLAVGSSYIALNGAYWLAALMPKTWFWDLSRYNVNPDEPKQCNNYTEALWFAIYHTGQTQWVRRSGAAPSSPAWDTWLRLAEENINDKNWDAVGAKDEIFKRDTEEARADNEFGRLPAEEEQPAKEVPPQPRLA